MSQTIIQECTLRGFLHGIICPEFGVYDRIPGAEIFAVRSNQKEATANQTDRGEAKATVRSIGEDEIKRATGGEGALVGRTDEHGFFCLNDRSYKGGLLDVYVCVRAVPGPEGKLLPLKKTSCLFLGTYAPGRSQGGWYLNLYIPQQIWCALKKLVDAWTVAGRVATCDGDQPLGHATVIARDVDITQDDLLGQAVTNGLGIFRIDYMGDAFRKGTIVDVELFGGPDLFFEVHDSGGTAVLTEDRCVGRLPGRCGSGPCKCVRLCVNQPPSVAQAWFTHVGDFDINSDIDPTGLTNTAANIGLPNEHAGPGYAFFDGDHGWGIKLKGDCPKRHPAGNEPMRYRFLYEDLVNDPGNLHPVTAAMLSGIVVGERPITWNVTGLGAQTYPQSIVVGPTGDEIPPGPTPPPPGPPAGSWGPIPKIFMKPDADGWVTMDPSANLNGYSGPLLYFRTNAVVAGGGAPGNGAGNAVADPKLGRPLRIVYEAEPTTGPNATSHTLGNELSKLKINNWSEVIELDLVEFVAANCCSPIDASLGILYTADHEMMLNWNVGISSCASGMGWTAPALPGGSGPRGGRGTSSHNTSTWPNCSYVVSLGTSRQLTDGEDEADGKTLQKTFCIEH